MSSAGSRLVAQTWVRVVAQPASVPVVRRLVDEALTTWGRTELIDDVSQSLTELATNATLHSQSTHFDVGISTDDHAVRIAVVDGGAMPARSIASRVSEMPVAESEDDFGFETMTGRGLFIVSALASSWGIDDLPDGTRVWADFEGGEVSGHELPLVTSLPDVKQPVASEVVVHLTGCPADLLLAHDEHLADIARDLGLFAASHADEESARSAEQIVDVVRRSALTWDAARLQAQEAVRGGNDLVDIDMAVADPADLPRKVSILQIVAQAADTMAEEGRLMALPATAEVQRWRGWVTEEMTEQVTTRREPRSFTDYLG